MHTRGGGGARRCSARATVMHTGCALPSLGGPRTQDTAAGRETGGGCAPMGRKPLVPESCSCSKRGRAGHTWRGPYKSPVSYEQAPGLAPHDGPPWAKLPTLGWETWALWVMGTARAVGLPAPNPSGSP